jgi:hypothetical protein
VTAVEFRKGIVIARLGNAFDKRSVVNVVHQHSRSAGHESTPSVILKRPNHAAPNEFIIKFHYYNY